LFFYINTVFGSSAKKFKPVTPGCLEFESFRAPLAPSSICSSKLYPAASNSRMNLSESSIERFMSEINRAIFDSSPANSERSAPMA